MGLLKNMLSKKFSKASFVKKLQMLSEMQPQTQRQEVFFGLLVHRNLSRRDCFLNYGILNAPALICILRKEGVAIKTESIETENKFGRKISYAKYSLINKDAAYEKYRKEFTNE